MDCGKLEFIVLFNPPLWGGGTALAVGEVIEISAFGAPHPALRATFPKGEGQR